MLMTLAVAAMTRLSPGVLRYWLHTGGRGRRRSIEAGE
jgi:hypothetical protein